jgi:sigma-B regulation protein RsbU (phosphoserine phosphatase)
VTDRLIAFLTESLDDEHEVRVLGGVLSAAKEIDAGVLCVAGGGLGDPDPARAARNFVFELVGPETASGVVALSSGIASATSPEDYHAWLGRFGSVPVCSLGLAVPGKPSVIVDNRHGVGSVVLHLIQAHGAERIAFIRGPAGSAEAMERLEAYRAALAEGGRQEEPRFEVEGDFTRKSGVAAIQTLLDERRVPAGALDAVVAANDYMALGAMEELGRRGIHVPNEVAVVGFDDVASASLAHPSLTTVRQPGAELGRDGVRKVAALAKNQPVGMLEVLPTELVVRASCGCTEVQTGLASQHGMLAQVGVDTSFVQRRQIILAEVMRAARGTFGAAGGGWEGRLLDALIAELRRGEPGGLHRVLEQILRKVERAHADARVVQDVISALRLQSLPCVASDPVMRARLEDAAHEARVVASVFTAQSEALRVREATARVRRFESRVRGLMFESLAAVADAAAEELTKLGVDAALLAELSLSGDPNEPGRVVFGFGAAGRRAAGEEIAMRSLARHPLFERGGRALVLLPVVLDRQPLGALLLSVSYLDGMLLEDLREFFGTVLAISKLRRKSVSERPR